MKEPKANGSVLADATDVETRSKLWELQRLLNNRKGSLSATYKENAEANTRAYDFEETMKKVTLDIEEGHMLYAVAYEVAEELDRPQKDQDSLQDELEFTCEGVVTASMEFINCWALHNAGCANVSEVQ